MKKTKVIDIDGILTKEIEGYSPDHYKNRTPIQRSINILKDYKNRGFNIVLHTARFPEDKQLTEDWLKKHDVPYDELILGKPQANTYYDDKAVNQLNQEVLCFSGGVDSLIAWHYLDKPKPIYVLTNHRYQRKEVHCIEELQRLIPDLNVTYTSGPNLHDFEVGDKAYIPQRNFHLALTASHYGNLIYIVGIKGDSVPDKNQYAYKNMSFAMNFIKKPSDPIYTIDSPFWSQSKTDIIKWFKSNYDYDYVIQTLKTSVSCYDKSTLNSCGRCPSCFRKWIGLESAGIKSYNWFEHDIREWTGISDYTKKMKAGEYDPQRTTETKAVLERYNLW